MSPLQSRFFDLLATLTNGVASTGVPPAAVAFINVYIKRLAKDPLSDHEITQVGMWMRDVAEALLSGEESELFTMDGRANLPELDARMIKADGSLEIVEPEEVTELHPYQHAEVHTA